MSNNSFLGRLTFLHVEQEVVEEDLVGGPHLDAARDDAVWRQLETKVLRRRKKQIVNMLTAAGAETLGRMLFYNDVRDINIPYEGVIFSC